MRRSFIFIFLSFLSGCSAPGTSENERALVNRGRTQVWAQNCQTCHNARSSRYYGDQGWDIAMHHMRIRGALTANESRSILEHLQSAN